MQSIGLTTKLSGTRAALDCDWGLLKAKNSNKEICTYQIGFVKMCGFLKRSNNEKQNSHLSIFLLLPTNQP